MGFEIHNVDVIKYSGCELNACLGMGQKLPKQFISNWKETIVQSSMSILDAKSQMLTPILSPIPKSKHLMWLWSS